MMLCRSAGLLVSVVICLILEGEGWITPPFALHSPSCHRLQPGLRTSACRAIRLINAGLFGDVADELRPALEAALEKEGWEIREKDVSKMDVLYRWNPKARMLQLVDFTQRASSSTNPPRWIKIEPEKEAAAQPERPLSTREGQGVHLKVEAANINEKPKPESASVNENYRPKWGDDDGQAEKDYFKRSGLGYSLSPMTFEEVITKAKTLSSDLSVQVLLLGGTDPPGRKKTHNGFDLSKSIRDVPDGIFVCCLSGLPIFATSDLSPKTLSSDWLMFGRPISPDHVLLIEGDDGARDPRVEVLCAKSKCHLGYYTAKDGFCISASTLDLKETSKMDPGSGTNNDRSLGTFKSTWKPPDPTDPATAANSVGSPKPEEKLYRPKWGVEDGPRSEAKRSALGYSLTPMTFEEVIGRAKLLKSDLSVLVLLQGKSDPPGLKLTHNGYDLSESSRDLPEGLFACCISGLPLFASSDLSPATESSGWLIFRRPLSPDHLLLIDPELDEDTRDPHIEVLDAKSRCHLGHYFGKEGFRINASVLNFIPVEQAAEGTDLLSTPVSYRSLEKFEQSDSSGPSVQFLREILTSRTTTKQVVLGGGPFHELEVALRRLPGVVRTALGYAGGNSRNPSYEDVNSGATGHAEVVMVEFDSTVLEPRVLIECFLELHVPTKILAYGRRAKIGGWHRSCIFVHRKDFELLDTVQQAIDACRMALGQDLSTVVYEMDDPVDDGDWFWPDTEQQQLQDELREEKSAEELATLSIPEWLEQYAKR